MKKRSQELERAWCKSVKKQIGPNVTVKYKGTHPSGIRVTLHLSKNVPAPVKLIKLIARELGITDKKSVTAIVERASALGDRQIPLGTDIVCFTVIGQGKTRTECFLCTSEPPRCTPWSIGKQ